MVNYFYLHNVIGIQKFFLSRKIWKKIDLHQNIFKIDVLQN
jgi:hypothetical protein